MSAWRTGGQNPQAGDTAQWQRRAGNQEALGNCSGWCYFASSTTTSCDPFLPASKLRFTHHAHPPSPVPLKQHPITSWALTHKTNTVYAASGLYFLLTHVFLFLSLFLSSCAKGSWPEWNPDILSNPRQLVILHSLDKSFHTSLENMNAFPCGSRHLKYPVIIIKWRRAFKGSGVVPRCFSA